MIKEGSNYIYGTAAEKIEYDVYEQNEVLKAKKRTRYNNKAKWRVVFAVLMTFGLCFALMYRYAFITEMNLTAAKLDKDYNKIRNENSILRVEVEKQTDLNKIREAAEKKLDMHKPDKHQIVYIYVPKSDFTVVSEGYENIEDIRNKGMLAVLFDRVHKFTRILY